MTKGSGFLSLPNRILEMGLDPFDLAVLIVLRRNNPSFPGYEYVQKTLGISKERVWKSLKTLQRCNIIAWERRFGKSNYYTMLPEGVWISKKGIVDKPKKIVRQTNDGSSYNRPSVVRQTNSNNTNLNNTNLIRGLLSDWKAKNKLPEVK